MLDEGAKEFVRLTIANMLLCDRLELFKEQSSADFAVLVDADPDDSTKVVFGTKPLVRCKDCKWWEKLSGSAQGCCYLTKPEVNVTNRPAMYPTGDWFCADGVRKDGEQDAST